MACSSTPEQAVCMLAISSTSMVKPVVQATGYGRGRRDYDQRNVCNGGSGRGDKRDRGQRQRVDVRNRVNGGHGRTQKGRQGVEVGRAYRLVEDMKGKKMESGIEGVSETRECVYDEARRVSGKRPEIPGNEKAGDSYSGRVARVLAQRQKVKESGDDWDRVLAGPSPLEVENCVGTAWNSRPLAGGSSS